MIKMCKSIGRRLAAWNRDETGATMVEYWLIVAFVAVPALAALLIFRDELWNMFASLWEDVQTQQDIG